MAPGRKRGAKGVKAKELRLGDLVLAKVKGFPAWPAKISRPEDYRRAPDPRKYFVQFYGTLEIAFVTPADIQPFTVESKNKLLARCKGKTVKYFAQAVNEISEEFEELQRKVASGIRDDESMQTVASEVHSVDGAVGESLVVNGNDGMDREGPEFKLETEEPCDLGSGLEYCLQKQDYVENEDDNRSLSSPISLGKRNKLSSNYKNVVKHSPSVSSPSHRSLLEEESPLDIKVKGKFSSDGPNELTNGHKPKVAIGSKKKSEAAMHIRGSAVPHEASGEIKRKSSLNVGSERKEKRLTKEKRRSERADDGQEDAELNSEELTGVISRKRLKSQHGREKQGNEAPFNANISKFSDTGDDANLIKAERSRKNDTRSPNIFNGKVFKRLTSVMKAEVSRPLRMPISSDDANHSSDGDENPPTKRHRRSLETTLSSALISDEVRSPVMQFPIKRRSVRLCDDEEDDEPQKTPIHGGITTSVSLVTHASDSKKKIHGESCVDDPLILVNKGKVDEQLSSGLAPNKGKVNEQLNSEKLPSVEVKSVSVSPKRSPQSIIGGRAAAELQSKHSNKATISRKKTPARDNKSASTSDRSASFLSNQASFGDKKKATPNSDLQINGSVSVVGTSNENITSVRERLNFGKDEKTSFAIDSKISDSATSMRHLIAAAQAKKRQAHLQNSYGNPFPFSIPDFDVPARGLSPTHITRAFESSKILQMDVQGSQPNLQGSPFPNVHQVPSINQHENEELEERRVSSGHQATGSSLSGGTEAAVARDAFEGMIETLSRTKESIARATRLAIDCAKYGLANEVVELLIQKLENEPSLHRRVDLFFLVDSITQCSHNQKGASYVSTVQAALPRLIGAAAPAGSGAQENRRQCHKVLRLWIERKILPESVLRRFLDDIGVVNDDTSVGISLRRPSRSERAIHDPIREMEGMVVDEYGSNVTYQLPGLLSANVFEEEEEEEFEDKLPTDLRKATNDTSPSDPSVTPSDRRHCILQDVDGELEMEDVSGNPKDEKSLLNNGTFKLASLELNSDEIIESALNVTSEWLPSREDSPPLPPGSPPETPPLPTSPPPSPPPPPPLPSSPPPPPPPRQNPVPQLFVSPPQPPVGPPPPRPIGPAPRAVGPPPPPPVGPHPPPGGPPPPLGPPPLPCQQLFPPQPPLVSSHMANFQGNHMDASGSQPSGFPPSGVREHVGYNSSRPIDYGQGDAYRQQFVPNSAPFAQPPQRPPSHYPYPNYSPYYGGVWTAGGRYEGYFAPPRERPPANNVNYQPPAPNTMPPPASQIPAHGVPMMPGRPDTSAINWRPA